MACKNKAVYFGAIQLPSMRPQTPYPFCAACTRADNGALRQFVSYRSAESNETCQAPESLAAVAYGR